MDLIYNAERELFNKSDQGNLTCNEYERKEDE